VRSSRFSFLHKAECWPCATHMSDVLHALHTRRLMHPIPFVPGTHSPGCKTTAGKPGHQPCAYFLRQALLHLPCCWLVCSRTHWPSASAPALTKMSTEALWTSQTGSTALKVGRGGMGCLGSTVTQVGPGGFSENGHQGGSQGQACWAAIMQSSSTAIKMSPRGMLVAVSPGLGCRHTQLPLL